MCIQYSTRTQTSDSFTANLKQLMSAQTIAILLVCSAYSAESLAYDYSFNAYGQTRVVQGHDIYIQETSDITEGTRAYSYYYVDGLPDGVTASWPQLVSSIPNNKAYQPSNQLLKIHIPSTTPTGNYTLKLRVESGEVNKQITYPITVEAMPSMLTKQVIKSIPPIPDLSKWESQMKAYGLSLCNEDTINAQSTWEGNIWYYDGMRVYQHIDDYTANDKVATGEVKPDWKTCIGYVRNVYRPYVMSTITPGWRVFPHGLYEDYLRNHDEISKAAVIRLATDSAYAKKAGGVSYGVNGLQRETAYIAHAYRFAGLLGSPNPELYARSIEFLLGAIDQEFVSKTDPYLKPFMVGLMMESLIQYYEESKDPRVPPAIKAAVDGLWERAWIPESKAFYYESTAPTKGVPDLNLLIAPAYAWLYKITGDTLYQERGDLIFEGGVDGAWLNQGKQFSQNYRWSFSYVNWRLHPDISPIPVPKSLKVIK